MKKLFLLAAFALTTMQMSAQVEPAKRTTEIKGKDSEGNNGYEYIIYDAKSPGAGRLREVFPAGEEFPAGKITCNKLILHGDLNTTDIIYLRKNLVKNEKSGVNPFECRMCLDLADVDFKAGGETLVYGGKTIKSEEDDVVPNYAFAGMGQGDGIPAASMVIFPERAKKIGEGACYNSNGFAFAVIGSETEEICEEVFKGCVNIRAIFIPKDNKLKKIKDYFINVGTNYSTMNLPAKLESVGKGLCESNNLKTIYIHSSNLKIGDGAIKNRLQNVYFYGAEAPTFGGGGALKFADGANIHVPVGAKDAYVRELNSYAPDSQAYGNTTFGTAPGKKDAADVVNETGMKISSVAGETWGTWSDDVVRTLPNGVKAYSVSDVNDDVLTLSEITGAIPATGSLLTAEVESVSDPTIYGGKELTIILGMDIDTNSNPTQTNVQVLNEKATRALKASVHEMNNAFYFAALKTDATPVIKGTNYLIGSGLNSIEIEGPKSTDGEYFNFVLGNVNNSVAFYRSNAGTLAPHKAYLKLPANKFPSNEPEAKSLRIVVDNDEATGINVNRISYDDNYYTLQGVKVSEPTRGVYVKNGKKVIIK